MDKKCIVCCEDFTLYKRKKVICNYCNYMCCTECVKKYLLNSVNDPNCMNCFNNWNKEYIDNILSKNFRISQLKKHRENILVNREKSKILETMPLVETKIKSREIEKEIEIMNRKKEELIREIGNINNQIYIKRSSLEEKKTSVIQNIDLALYQSHCPNENCVGFLYNNKCNICQLKTCNNCNKIILKLDKEKKIIYEDNEHKCLEEDIENAKILKKNTKNCPNCRAPIYKISGCRQMFCCNKDCHTCFDWQTGEIIKDHSRVHNPHLYEYIRANPDFYTENQTNDNCNTFINSRNLVLFLKSKKIKEETQIFILDFHRSINHFINFELYKYPINLMNGEKITNLRVSYILKEITEEYWKNELQKIENRNYKNKLFRDLIEMYIDIGKDILRKIKLSKNLDINEICEEIENLRIYFNQNISIIYKNTNSSAKIKMLTIDFIYS